MLCVMCCVVGGRGIVLYSKRDKIGLHGQIRTKQSALVEIFVIDYRNGQPTTLY